MKRNFHLPVLARVVVAAVLASFIVTASSRVHAQVTVYRTQQYNGYYNPYGQGPYGGYGQDPAPGAMFPDRMTMVGSRPYGYSGYVDRANYGNGSYVRVHGGTSYYQPFFGTVYVPFGY